ncbi:XRE family transcriptional regulator [Burkholderia singularis]|uniref:XRE family transcriptional regulator n=1 Tax=Burkholderia singularis TaxID=1503053 RepID=A0A103DZG5_9BURK|nr:helix-turn-helix transcriptional regulator [Burkholderia singularis]KVE25548.1 XRE family transcriptional regulator [Burkholderia singularis]
MESPAATAFGKALKRLRNERAMSQYALANAAEIDRIHVSRLERGLRSPNLETMLALARGLRVSLAELSVAIEVELAANS